MSAGVITQISFKKESTWGTAVVPDKSVAVRPTGGITINEGISLIPAIKGQLQKNYTAIKGKTAYSGSFTIDAFADYIGYLILSAMGTDTPATHSGETIVYDHVFTETVPKPSLTIEQGITENCRRFAGTIVKNFKITGKVGEMLMFDATVMSKTQATSTQVSGAFTAIPAFTHNQLVVKIGGSSIAEVESFEIEYDNGLDLVYALGQLEPQFQSIAGGSTVKGKIDLYLDSTSLATLTDYIAGTPRSLELIATNPATIGSAANYVLDITAPKAIYTANDSKVTDNHNLLSLSFEAYYDTGTSKMLAITLTNLLASY